MAALDAALHGLYRTAASDAQWCAIQAQLEARAAGEPLSIVIAGPRGAGKTTCARRLGSLLHALGLVPTERVTLVTAQSLGGRYVGEAQALVRGALREARGGALVIDEAGWFAPCPAAKASYASAAAGALLAALQEPEFRGSPALVLAGDGAELAAWLGAAAGSGLGQLRLALPPWDPAQCVEATLAHYAASNASFTPGAVEELGRGFAALAALPHFASAREVYETLPAKMNGSAALRRKKERAAAGVASPSLLGAAAGVASPSLLGGAAGVASPSLLGGGSDHREFVLEDVRDAMEALAAQREGYARTSARQLVSPPQQPQQPLPPQPPPQPPQPLPQVQGPPRGPSPQPSAGSAARGLLDLCREAGYSDAEARGFFSDGAPPGELVVLHLLRGGAAPAKAMSREARREARAQLCQLAPQVLALLLAQPQGGK